MVERRATVTVELRQQHPGRKTSRDLLVKLLGKLHETHSVVSKRARRITIIIKCSCGTEAITSALEEHKDALRNVPEAKE